MTDIQTKISEGSRSSSIHPLIHLFTPMREGYCTLMELTSEHPKLWATDPAATACDCCGPRSLLSQDMDDIIQWNFLQIAQTVLFDALQFQALALALAGNDLGRCEPTDLLHAVQNVVAAEPQLRSSAFIWVYLRSVFTTQIPTALPGVLWGHIPWWLPGATKGAITGRRSGLLREGGRGRRWGGTGRAVVACCSRVL